MPAQGRLLICELSNRGKTKCRMHDAGGTDRSWIVGARAGCNWLKMIAAVPVSPGLVHHGGIASATTVASQQKN